MRVAHLVERLRCQRGGIALFLAISMTALLGSAAISIDVGHMMNARAQSQAVADLSALAGAAAFIQAPGPTVATTADTWAKQFALLNTVDRSAVSLLSSDIGIDVPNRRVQVTVFNTAARGNPVSTVFARVLGINSVDIVTTAIAEAAVGGGVTCILPLFLVDQWDELGGSPLQFDNGIDYYEPYIPSAWTATYTGYDQSDIGMSIVIKPAQGPMSQTGAPNQSWYYPFDAANIPGGAAYRAAISGCTDPSFVYSIGMSLWVEPGAMIGPTAQGFQDLINQDPSATWDPGLNCVVDASNLGSGNGANCRASPRLRPAPMLDPSSTPASGKQQVTITNFAGIFVDRVQGNNVYVTFAGWSGVGLGGGAGGGGGGGGGAVAPIVLYVRLIL